MAPNTDREPRNDENLKEEMSVPTLDAERQQGKDRQLWRDLAAYWILGLCNNYGYVIMLSAAHDIIKQFDGSTHNDHTTDSESSGRQCNLLSTGAVLLADIIPALLIKMIAPFLPFWVHTQTIAAISTSVAGFLLVAFAETEWVALLGIISTSFSSGLGETVFLAYSSRFNKNVVSTWSSGTGGSGIIGSLSYTLLTSLKLTPRTIMLIMISFPVVESAAFWLLLRHPKDEEVMEMNDSDISKDTVSEVPEDEKPLVGMKEKLTYVLSLTPYMAPLTLVYLFEYFINQGLFELVYFKDIWLDKDAQYRWLCVDYQLGVFISRSTVNLFAIENLWLLSMFQFINVIYFVVEVIWLVTPNIWIVFAIVFWEGLLGGSAYVNTFYRMSKEIPNARKAFAIGTVTVSDSSGVAAAGLIAIPIHNLICKIPAYNRLVTF